MTTPETLETRVASIKHMREANLITDAEMGVMLESASRTPFTGVRPAAREPVVAQGTALTSLETQESKAQREVRTIVERLLGTSDRPALDKAILDFILDPAKTSSFAKARLETLFREAGLGPTGQGTQLLLILKDAVAGQPLALLLGEGPVLTMARAFSWKFLCRVLAVYGVCTHERTTGNTLSARERQEMEDAYLAKVLKPQEAGDGSADVSRILLNALGWAQKQEEVTNTTLKRGTAHADSPPKAAKVTPKVTPAPPTRTATQIAAAVQAAAGGSPAKGGPMPSPADIPADFSTWTDFKAKLAWAKPHGLCILCLDKGKIRVGVQGDHQNHR